MEHSSSPTLAQMVLEDPACADVFQHHRIDFCCAGHRTLESACVAQGIEVARVRADLEAVKRDGSVGPSSDPRRLSTSALLSLIVSKHHGYLRRALPAAVALSGKVARVHGGRQPKLLELATAVSELADTLEPHLDEEEQSLFPALEEGRAPRADVSHMLDEHLAVAVMLDRIHDASDGFAAPSWGCASYRALVAELRALDADVREHVHLENHVLLPRFVPGSPQA